MNTLQTKKVALADATLAQLQAFATINLGLDIPEKANKTALLSIIQSAYNGDTIQLVEAQAPSDKLFGGRPARTRIRPGTEHLPEAPAEDSDEFNPHGDYQVHEVCIQIDVQDKPGGKAPVFCSVNGRGIYIERGKPQWVRDAYVEVLEHAITWEHPENKDLGPHNLGGLDDSTRREVRAYPFSFV
jgi:hypothetical protein